MAQNVDTLVRYSTFPFDEIYGHIAISNIEKRLASNNWPTWMVATLFRNHFFKLPSQLF